MGDGRWVDGRCLVSLCDRQLARLLTARLPPAPSSSFLLLLLLLLLLNFHSLSLRGESKTKDLSVVLVLLLNKSGSVAVLVLVLVLGVFLLVTIRKVVLSWQIAVARKRRALDSLALFQP